MDRVEGSRCCLDLKSLRKRGLASGEGAVCREGENEPMR
jgi:hypothetical protein